MRTNDHTADHAGNDHPNDPAVWQLNWRFLGRRYLMLLSSPDGIIAARGAQRLAAIIAEDTDTNVGVELLARFDLDDLPIG